MSNAGYGNHDASPPGGAAKAGEDRAGNDRGGSPAKGAAGSVPTDMDDESNTPGAGTLPGKAQGGEVDPAAG